jgi:hypothetical protein
MNSPIETYLKTKMERDRMRDQLHALGAKLANFASALMHRPERCSFANTDIGLPAEVTFAPDTVFMNVDEWKTALEIQKMIKAFHDADEAVGREWSQIPTELKSGLQPPGVYAPAQRTAPAQRLSLSQSRRGQWSR